MLGPLGTQPKCMGMIQRTTIAQSELCAKNKTILYQLCHNCIFKSGTEVSDASIRTHSMVYKSSRWPQSIVIAKNSLRDKFSLSPIQLKTQSLTSRKCS